MSIIHNEADLGRAIKNNQESIEIEGDLAKKVIRIKATGKLAWAIAIASIVITVGIVLTLPVTAPATAGATAAANFAVLGPAIGIMGVGPAIAAVSIAVAGGGIAVLNKLRKYKITKISDKHVKLTRQ
jgi:hypothetical protein